MDELAISIIVLVVLWIAWNFLEVAYHLTRLVGYILWSLPMAFFTRLVKIARTNR